MGCIDLHLDRCVADVELRVEALGDARHEGVPGVALWHDEMSGERVIGRAHAPDVQIMNFGDARHAGEVGAHAFDLDALRHRLQRQSHRIPEQTPGAEPR